MYQKLTTEIILQAYRYGLFPMADPASGYIKFYSPDPRAILPLDSFHVSKTLRKLVQSSRFEIRFDRDFSGVIRACADRELTWISQDIISLYQKLHKQGYAHSVECWYNGGLAGGLYGVALGGCFFGESMFHHERDASKVALVALVEKMKLDCFKLLDVQYSTSHLRQFGVIEIPKMTYLEMLADAVESEVFWH